MSSESLVRAKYYVNLDRKWRVTIWQTSTTTFETAPLFGLVGIGVDAEAALADLKEQLDDVTGWLIENAARIKEALGG